MLEPAEQAALHRRATWVGLRTLRQRPKVVDHNEHGEPVFEVRSVRLALPPEGDHFDRLVPCGKCGHEVPGPPVRSPADLDRPAFSVVCDACVSVLSAATAWPPAARTVRADPAASAPTVAVKAEEPDEAASEPAPETEAKTEATLEPEAEAEPTVDAPPPIDEPAEAPAPMAIGSEALHAELADALARVTDLADVQRAESIKRRDGDIRLQGALVQLLGRVRAEIATASDGSEARAAAIEDSVSRAASELNELVTAQRTELAALGEAAAAIRAELQQATQAGRALMRWSETVEARLTELADAQAAGSAAAQDEDVRVAVKTVTEAVEQLARTQGRLEAKLDGLAEQATSAAQWMSALQAAGDAGDGRLHDLEQKTQDAVTRLAELVDLVESRRPVRAERLEPAPGPEPGVPAGELVDALERQLQQAELRLAQRGR